MRITAICMILLLASQAGAAIVCPTECAPAALPAMAHHGHGHHMHAPATATATMSAAQCGKLMVAESVLASASRVPEFALAMPVTGVSNVKLEAAAVPIPSRPATLPSNSPPKYSVLRI
jgi:hypothetical protein